MADLESISNRFTKMFGIPTPFVSAPMGYATDPTLVAAVINAGGLGFLDAGTEPAEKLADTIEQTRALVLSTKRHLVSMGFFGWALDNYDSPTDPRLETVLDKKPAAVWLAFGEDLGKHIHRVREHDSRTGHQTRVFVTVNTMREAVEAALEWKPDVLVVQGLEAGGRGSTFSPPLRTLFDGVTKAIPSPPILLAAGGIMTGTQAAQFISRGADGVVLGTRLLFTTECAYTDEMKAALVAAGPDSTVRSPAYDVLFSPGLWPNGIEARCLKNAVVADFEAGLDIEELKTKIAGKEPEYAVIHACTDVSAVRDIAPVADVMKKLNVELITSLRNIACIIA